LEAGISGIVLSYMSRLETPRSGRLHRDAEPPEARDPQLDEWFTRRLESQGIPARVSRVRVARLLAVSGLCIALLGLSWAFSGAGSSHSSTPAAPTKAKTGRSTSFSTQHSQQGGGGKQSGKLTWKDIPIDVLNGFGGSGAASATQELLQSRGWHVRSTGNAATTTVQHTVVVYTPGNLKKARIVARKLGLGPPEPISSEPAVSPSQTGGVAVLLGSDLLPA
jgi:LytR cell envelope-related transcriptional attenuator